MFDQAVATIRRAPYEDLNSDFQQTDEEFKALEKAIEEKFGDVAPDLSVCRNALNEISQEIAAILEKKRLEEPIRSGAEGQPPDAAGAGDKVSPAVTFSLPEMSGSTGGVGGSWNDAEALVRSGQIEKGLAQMIHLAASGDLWAESFSTQAPARRDLPRHQARPPRQVDSRRARRANRQPQAGALGIL